MSIMRIFFTPINASQVFHQITMNDTEAKYLVRAIWLSYISTEKV